MAPVTDPHLAVLTPYIGDAKPDHRGEIQMYCPLHHDTNRSASLNLEKGCFFCHAGCGGGSIRALVDAQEVFVPIGGRDGAKALTVDRLKTKVAEAIFMGQDRLVQDVVRWHQRLLKDKGAMQYLYELRGIEEWTVRKALLGFDGSHYKIPVFSPDRTVWNIRTYDPEPSRGRRKIWSLRGFGRARLYPAGILERAEQGDAIVFCEGEWDALLALQAGALAITRTDGAGKPWRPEWNIGFAGLRVFVCHDADSVGQEANRVVTAALAGVAAEVRECTLPYGIAQKHGRDLTDFLMDAEEPGQALTELMHNAKGAQTGDSNTRMRTSGIDSGAYAY